MIKKITLGLTVLLSTVSLNSFASASPSTVSVPCYNGGFSFGLAGLYLRPSSEALDFGLVYPTAAPIDGVTDFRLINGKVSSVKPDYDWGYKLNIGYVFPGTANDVSLTYSDFRQSQSDSTGLQRNELFFGTITPVAFAPLGVVSTFNTDTKSRFDYQAVDLDFGQHINIGCNTHVRFLGGLRYVNLKNQFDANYESNVQLDADAPLETLLTSTSQTSKFHGVGPRFGMDTEYSLGNGFGVVGQATTALLVGSSKSNYYQLNRTIDGSEAPVDVISSYSRPETTRVVPNLTAKLGLDYKYQFCNPTRTKLIVEAGYQVDHFFNSADRLNALGIIGASNGVSVDTNFAGPYVGVQVKL